MSFETFPLHPDLLRGLHGLGFTEPTPIQTKAIPPALEGRDVLACAMTGSGKTAAFLLPILQRLAGKPRGVTRALVLAPTRELAAQIDQHRRELGRFVPVTGAAVLVATPGRLLDHLGRPYTRLGGIEVLVLDEADRMLDMGFLPDIRRIMKALPAGPRQTLLFSATLPPEITALARELLREPARIDVERPAAPATGVSHAAYPVSPELKLPLLVELLRRPEVRSMLVFTRTKHRANRLAEGLLRRGVKADRIHGNRSQAQRTQALAAFKTGAVKVLVATDVAARGIDVTGLSHVVNFDVPGAPEDYIHRVGRTARAGEVGDAITLVSPAEESDLRAIERAVGTRIARVTVAGFDYTARPAERLEVPLAERIAAIRARKAEERARARANAARRLVHAR
jgi:ATP-dependent RNA helicase RhlE